MIDALLNRLERADPIKGGAAWLLIAALGVAALVSLGGCAEVRRVGNDQYSLSGAFDAQDFYARQARQSGGSAE